MVYMYVLYMNCQWTTSPLRRPAYRCYAKSPTVQDAFQPIQGLISCTGVTMREKLLSHALTVVRWWLASSKAGSGFLVSLCAAVFSRALLVVSWQPYFLPCCKHRCGGLGVQLCLCALSCLAFITGLIARTHKHFCVYKHYCHSYVTMTTPHD